MTNSYLSTMAAKLGIQAFRGDVRPAASDPRDGVIAGRIAATGRKRAP